MPLRLKQTLRALLPKEDEPVHFLHIGKCAGTQIGHAIGKLNERRAKMVVKKNEHDTYLRDIPASARYFFSIRDPIARFRSGFYSRQRKGQPRYYYEWTSGEAQAFADFAHANDLAEALFENGELGSQAFRAIRSIRHTAQNQVDWFGMSGDFLERRPPLWIVRQEHFEADMLRLSKRMGEKLEVLTKASSQDPNASHSNDYSGVPDFTSKAIENLRRWYAQDLVFYDQCESWIERQ